MNYIEQFMDDNRIKVNEEFYVIDENGDKIGGLISIIFYFDKNMRLNMKLVESDCRDVLRGLMSGECKIEKIPKKPKSVWDLTEEDMYYYIDMCGDVDITAFRNGTYLTDEKIIKAGNAFLTKEEADAQDNGHGDTFIFNSPKAIDEKEAARQMKKVKQQLSLSY